MAKASQVLRHGNNASDAVPFVHRILRKTIGGLSPGLLRDASQVADAEQAYRRAVEISQTLWQASPQNVSIGNDLAGSLNNLGNLLRDAGQVAEADAALRRAVEISQTLWEANRENMITGPCLALGLINLGNLLRDAGQVADAEQAYRRALEIREALWQAHPHNVDITA